ncbi:response regulator [Methylobacterium sp. P31]
MRIFCLEDNPLIVFHIEHLIDDMGHVFAGALESFYDLKENFCAFEFDAALVDIDLADGRTGPSAAAWLLERGIRTIFVTGQEQIADQHRDVAIAIIGKPISAADFAAKLRLFSAVDK